LGLYDDAERHLTRALEEARALPAPIFLGEACRDFATLLLERDQPGDRFRARPFIDECITVSDEIGLAILRQQAAKLEQRLGRAFGHS
jgi:hypothetical protein